MTSFPTAKLAAAIDAVCPIEGVSIGRANDRTTWRIDFAEEASDAQRKDAEGLLTAFDPDAPENRPVPPRDFAAEIDALKMKNEALEAALIKKAIVTTADIEAEQIAVATVTSPDMTP